MVVGRPPCTPNGLTSQNLARQELSMISRRRQQAFNPADYDFQWTDDWYAWDQVAATRKARDARDEQARILARQGCEIKKFTLKNQLVIRGGIGTGKPEITMLVTVYGLNIS
jgi:hypothetical protein